MTPSVYEWFPRMPKARKPHRCRLCGQVIPPEDPRCRWKTFDDGPCTYHAHPECYQFTLDKRWDNGDWECCFEGDIERPAQLPLSPEQRKHFNLTEEEARFWSYFPQTVEIQQTVVGSPLAAELLTPHPKNNVAL